MIKIQSIAQFPRSANKEPLQEFEPHFDANFYEKLRESQSYGRIVSKTI